MIFYFIHNLPIWNDIENGKRNVRILMITMVLYMILHFLVNEYADTNTVCCFMKIYFNFILLADIFINAITYKLYYGRSVLYEMSDTDIKEKHVYNDETHKYSERKNDSSKKNKKNKKNKKEIK